MTSRAERVKALTDKLEQGVQEVFSSGQYQAWLNTLAKFPPVQLQQRAAHPDAAARGHLCGGLSGLEEKVWGAL